MTLKFAGRWRSSGHGGMQPIGSWQIRVRTFLRSSKALTSRFPLFSFYKFEKLEKVGKRLRCGKLNRPSAGHCTHGRSNMDRIPSRVTDFLLHDGRLLRAGQIRTGMQGSLLPDSAFLKILAQSGVRQQPDDLPVLQVFRSLFATAKLREPNVPPRPEYSGQGTGTFQRSIGVGSKVKTSVFGDGIKIDSMMPSD
jgi:hypothetical protein